MPHNGNVSNGLMFGTRTSRAGRLRAIMPSAAWPTSPWPKSFRPRDSPTPTRRSHLATSLQISQFGSILLDGKSLANSATGSYLRQAYGVGQELQEKIGANPFKYGIEGGSDFHSGIDTTEPSNYAGSHGNQDNDPRTVVTATKSVGGEPPAALSSGGLTGVWAEENTRESIFAAFKRKETFGTSGTRIKVRMFASWNYPKGMTKNADWVKTAYANGVPMGGDLATTTGKAGPSFVRSRDQGSGERQS